MVDTRRDKETRILRFRLGSRLTFLASCEEYEKDENDA